MTTTSLRQVARPQVFTHRLPAGEDKRIRFRAECAHCRWQYENTVKTDVAYHASTHRNQHRAGITTAA